MKINDIVFTNHAIERLKERGISGDLAWQTVKHPDKSYPGKEKSTTEFVKIFNTHEVTAICKKNNIGEWVILSAWIDPPLQGTKDFAKREKYLRTLDRNKSLDKKMKSSGFWGKLWITMRKQLGF